MKRASSSRRALWAWSMVAVTALGISTDAATVPEKPASLPAVPESAGMCLTGNAPVELVARNRPAPGGGYTFHDGYTDAEFFPTQPDCWEKGYTAGWVPFDKGVLTLPTPGTGYLRWGHYWLGQNGIDIVVDLKKEYRIRRVDIQCYQPNRQYLKHLELYLKSPGEARYTLTHVSWDSYAAGLARDPATGRLPEGWPRWAYAFENVNASARWVRIHDDTLSWLDLGAIRVWGDDALAKAEPKRAVILGGEAIPNPKELPFNLPEDCAVVFPIPQQIKLTGNDFALTADTVIGYEGIDRDRARTTAEVLHDEIKRETGLNLKVEPRFSVNVSREERGQGAVVPIGHAAPGWISARAIIVSDLVYQSEPMLSDIAISRDKPGPQGYGLRVDASTARIIGSDAAGALNGAQSLLQLLKRSPQGWTIRGAEIVDWPVCKMRYVEGRRAVTEDLIRVLARLKINYYHIYSLSQAEKIAPLVPFAERYGVRLALPADPRFVFRDHPELIELNPGENHRKMELSRANFCPSNPKTWETYFAELDKWIDTFNSDYIAIGFDEMYQSGSGARYNVCPLCRARNLHSWEVLAGALNTLAEHFAKHGKKIYMLDTCFYGPSISYNEDTDKDWRKALDRIPQDILMGVWHPKEVNALFADKGIPQIRWVNTPYGKKVEKFPLTTVAGAEYRGMVINMLDGPFSYTRLVGLAQVCWSPNRSYPDDEAGSLAMDRVIPAVRRVLDNAHSISAEAAPDRFYSIDLSAAANRSRADETPCDGRGWVDLGPNLDLRSLQPGQRTLGGIPFLILDEKGNAGKGCVMSQNRGLADRTMPSRAEFVVGKKAAGLVFLHTIEQRPGQSYLRKNEHAGYYLICYDDGAYAKMDIKYNINVLPWLAGPRDAEGNLPPVTALKRAWVAWRGETRSGQIATLYATEWTNPRPNQTITKVIVQAAWKMSPMNPILLACTGIAPTGAESDEKGTWPKVSNLISLEPVGKPMDLTGGHEEEWTRYVAPDGTVIDGSQVERVETGYHPGTHPFVGSVAVALAGGNHFYQPKGGRGTLDFTFPAPRMLTGVVIQGPSRSERKDEDFGPASFTYSIAVSEDGENWNDVTKNGRLEEEQGPWFVPIDVAFVKKVRLTGNGFSLVRFYTDADGKGTRTGEAER